MTDSTMAGHLLARRYRLVSVLGRGGMGVVWQGRDELLGRSVAIKEILLPPELPDEEREVLRRRTLREARSAGRLSHPNVVTVYDVVEEDGRPWIVMELVRSTTLAQATREYGPLPPGEVARIGLQVLAALHAAHRAGVLHRDVKPSNVLLTGDGRVVLTDFGIATLEGDPSLTTSGTLLGSPAFIAPERIQGRGAGKESDLWSLGATLYTAVEGRPPYDRGTTLPTLAAAVTEEPDPAQLAGPLWPALEGLLRKDPADRIDVWEARRLLHQAETGSEAAVGSPGADAVDTSQVDSGQRTRVLPIPPVVTPPPEYADAQPTGDGTPVATPAGGPIAAPGSAPSEERESSNGNLPKVVGAMLACVVVAVALVGWALFRAVDDNQGSQSQSPVSPQASGVSTAPRSTAAPSSTPPPTTRQPSSPATSKPASPSSRPTSPESPATEPGSVPAGFERHTDPTGFSLAVPTGWTVERRGVRVYFREPGGARFLLIDQTDQPKPDPVADWRQQEASRQDSYDDYQRIRIEPVDYFEKAADWEFTYATPSGRRHVLIRGVVTSDNQAYGIYWSTPDTQWTESRPLYRTFTTTFQPSS